MSSNAGLVLASASARRRELLAKLGLEFTIDPAGIDEQPPERSISIEVIARELAWQKAIAVAGRRPGSVILAADTIVTLDGNLLGKPSTADEARAMLTALRGRRHTVITGVATASGGQLEIDHAATGVLMRDYPDQEIEATINAGTPFDKAGSYAIQDPAFDPVARFDGCYCNVVGLPLATTIGLLRRANIDVPITAPSQLLPQCQDCPLFQ